MRQRRPDDNRRGSALVETAIVLMLFLTVVLGMLDMGLSVFRNNVVCEAARQGARVAAVHGNLAPSNNTTGMNSWGPIPSNTYYQAPASQSLYKNASYNKYSAAYTVLASNTSDELANAVRPYLPGVNPGTATVGIFWPDSSNDVGNRVTVFITTPSAHFIPFIYGNSSVQLTASSTMTVAH